MTEQDKKLLLKDLCARLPYGVQCEIGGLRYGPYTFTGDDVEDLIDGRTFKPYLRPISSMTEEEKKEFNKVLKSCNDKVFACPDKERRYNFFDAEQEDFMNAHHFDYRGLIEKGLALEAPKDMYKTE